VIIPTISAVLLPYRHDRYVGKSSIQQKQSKARDRGVVVIARRLRSNINERELESIGWFEIMMNKPTIAKRRIASTRGCDPPMLRPSLVVCAARSCCTKKGAGDQGSL
jgi:hypothetical protein